MGVQGQMHRLKRLECQRTAQVPASDPKPHWWDVNCNNLLPLIMLFFSCFQLTRYSVITERKREQEAENIPLEHQHRSGQIFLVSVCLSNLSHVAWCFNDLRVCKSLKSDSCKWEFGRFHQASRTLIKSIGRNPNQSKVSVEMLSLKSSRWWSTFWQAFSVLTQKSYCHMRLVYIFKSLSPFHCLLHFKYFSSL